MRLIGRNSLNNFVLILIIIAHSSSLLRISSVLMSPYNGGMERVFTGSIVFVDVCGNGQEYGEWGGDLEFCMRVVWDYAAAQYF